ncbi:MAG: hypothetical protein ABSD41_06340, partial [Candidatus Bathyarchaeia archaeon]
MNKRLEINRSPQARSHYHLLANITTVIILHKQHYVHVKYRFMQLCMASSFCELGDYCVGGAKNTEELDSPTIKSQVDSSQSNDSGQATRLLSRVTFWGFIATIGISIISTVGWLVNLKILTQFGPEYIPMAPNTALMFLMLSLPSIVYLHRPGKTLRHVLAITC